MIVVDTSVWVAFFNDQSCAEVLFLDGVLEERERDIVMLPVILTEVLQGFRKEADFRKARGLFTRLPVIEPSVDTHIRAADLYRLLRKKGITPRGAVDCIIASTCIETDAELLTLDRDFQRIAEHTPLTLVRP